MEKFFRLFIKLFLLAFVIGALLFYFSRAVEKILAQNSLSADFNSDGKVDLLDFEIWRSHRFPRVQPTISTSPLITETPTSPIIPSSTLPPIFSISPSLPPSLPSPTNPSSFINPTQSCRTIGQSCNLYQRCCSGLSCELITGTNTKVCLNLKK